jgi:Acetyltransferase (GNAT) domain
MGRGYTAESPHAIGQVEYAIVERFHSGMTLSLEWIEPEAAAALLGPCGSWRQFPAYAREAAARVGATSRHALVRRGAEAIALASLRTRRLPGLGPFTLLSHGPALLGPAERHPADLADALACLAANAGAEGLGTIELDADPALALGTPAASFAPFRPETGRKPYRTMVVDLSGGAEAVRRGLDPKWRRDLQRAEREGLSVTRSADPADFLKVQPLLADLAAAKGFGVAQDCVFFAKAAERAQAPERFFVHLVSRDGELLSGHIGAYSGNLAVYLLGATNAAGRPLRAAYLAQWAAIECALEHGLGWYDLGGIDPAENPDVFRFKRRMGGREVENAGTFTARAPGWRGAALAALRAFQHRRKP